MKQFLLLLFIGMTLVAQDLDSKLNELIVYKNSNKDVVIDYNPFINENAMKALMNESNTTSSNETKKEMKLVSIINQKAFIGGKWYGVGEMIEGKKIIKINADTVEIKQGSKSTILAFEASKDLLKIKDSKK